MLAPQEQTQKAPTLRSRFGQGLVFLFLLQAAIFGVEKAQAASPLSNEISVIQSTATQLQNETNQLTADFSSDLATLHLNLGGLINGGIANTTAGSTIQWPLYFIASTFSVTAVQVDIVIPSSFTVIGVSAGPIATNAGKSVSTSVVNGNQRILIAGLNQTPLGSGPMVILTLRTNVSIPLGLYPFSLINPIASDLNGKSIVISGESGMIEIN